MSFISQKTNKQATLFANIRQEMEDKKCQKFFFKVLEKQNLQNQYLNYILMIKNQNILAILKTFSNLIKKRKIYKTKTIYKATTTKFLGKFLPKRKHLIN